MLLQVTNGMIVLAMKSNFKKYSHWEAGKQTLFTSPLSN